MTYTLYEYAPTRSARVRWTLLELDQPFESIEGRRLIRSDELKKVSPLGKLPALITDEGPLYESAAICTYLADRHADKNFIPKPGTYQRGLHEQWTSFSLCEVEAHVWSSTRNRLIYEEENRVPAIMEQNAAETKKGLSVFEDRLGDSPYLLGDEFQVTDIIAAYAVNWAGMFGLTEGFDNVNAWLDRLRARPHCTLSKG
ncbi:MAG: glutathione S-transferase family protein [Parvularculaceae bacterium]